MRIPTYESHQQISSVNASTGGVGYDVNGFVNAAGMQRARGLDKLADGLNKLNAAVTAYNIDKRQEQLDLDLLKDMQSLKADSTAFMDGYVAKNKGVDARDAALAGQAFFEPRLAGLREKYAESPQGLKYIEAHGGGLALQGISALSDYSRREGEAYKDSVYEGELEQAKLRLLDHNTPDSERAAIYEDLRRKTVGFYKGRDATGALARLEGYKQKVDAEAWQNRLAYMRETNPEEAVRLAKAAVQGGGGEPAAGQGQARGLRNNNPGNIVKTASAWDGEVQGNDSRFKSFATPEHGIAAVGKNLLSYEKKGLVTVESIINRWAPPKENDTGAYINRVAKDLGVSPNARLNMRDPAVLSGLARAIIAHENGGNPYSAEQMQAGIEAALGKRALPKNEVDSTIADGASGGAPNTSAASDLARALSPQQLSAELHKAESEISRRDAETAATEADNMALEYLARVQNGEDFDAVHKDILALAPKLRGPVNTLFQSHHRDWHNANVLKSNDAIVDNRNAMDGMTLGQAYKFVNALPESSPLERTVKKQALADYALAAQHGGMHKTTDPNVYSQLVEAIHYGEIRDEKALRAHPQAVAVAENDLKKLLTDIKGASTITEKSLQTAYRWAVGKSEDDPKAGALSDSEKRDFMKFSDWARATAAKTAKAGDPEYARTLARMWRMEGETRSRIHPGYGKDQRFGAGMEDSTWLPELKGEYRTLVNQKFRENPAMAAKWAERYDGNMEWGMRGYLKALLQQDLEPAKRPAPANEPTQAESQ